MKRLLLISLAGLLISSCGTFFEHQGDRKVASIGRDVLYESEVLQLLPEEVSPEDSAALVRKYADTWALGKLLLLKAQKELSKADADVSDQVEEYRRNLLGFRYEKKYVESRLDTVVTDSEIEKYYGDHPANYVFPYSIVKARVARISTKSPYYDMIKEGFDAEDGSAKSRLEELCLAYAERYTDFGGQWIPVALLAKEIGEDIFSCEMRVDDRLSEKQDGDVACLVFIAGRVAPNELSPVEYNRENIKETIISKRKQELLSKLEQDLLVDAVSDKTLKIYTYDE